jgi:hypothetical protein
LDEEDHSDDSQQKPINFTDIAAGPLSVHTDVPPARMLESEANHPYAGRKCLSCSPLQKAIVEDDFEAFVHTLDLHDFAGTRITINSGVYNLVVTLDRPEMLDEFIRREGVGIVMPSDGEEGRLEDLKVSEERVYLGLPVGGQRHAGISNHKLLKHFSYNFYDFLRTAIRSGATKVIDYLAGPRPIAAFMHYAETHDDKTAKYLKSIDNLDAVFPELLGWQPDGMNETPLLCAVINDRLDILKQMFALKPSLMEEALYLRCG